MSDYNNKYVPYDFEPIEEPEEPRRKRRTALKVTALALACAIVGGAGGAGLTSYLIKRQSEVVAGEEAVQVVGNSESSDSQEAAPAQGAAQSGKTENKASAATPLISTKSGEKNMTPQEVYNQNVNAVVGINVTGTTSGTNVWGYATPFASSGSGFIISKDGYIVTNNHVIENADDIKVSLFDGSSYDAELVGSYEYNDVALLKVEADGDLPCVTIGDSSKLAVGDEVAAIGNPLGQLTFSLTVGYVSALDRSINTDGTPINMLQTDAAINSGNSGGPLFDMSGSVVGITTAKASSNAFSSGASIEGIGFAIPINDVLRFINDIKENGHVTGEPYLGVSLKEIDSQTAGYYGLPAGVYVGKVVEGSCAEKAGVKEGDIITGLAGTDVKNYAELSSELRRHRAGDTIELSVYREGSIKTFQCTLDEKKPEPEEEQQAPAQQPVVGGDAYRIDPFNWGF